MIIRRDVGVTYSRAGAPSVLLYDALIAVNILKR
jgi:hypothetical protein